MPLSREEDTAHVNPKHSSHNHTLSSNIVTFNSKSADVSVQCLSNFAPLAVTVDGIEYPTGEHAFHGCKFLFCASKCSSSNAARRNALQKRADLFAHPSALKNGLDAKRAGGKSKQHGFALSQEELEGWHREATRVQEDICRCKLTHYVQVQEALAATKNKLLLHQDNRAKKDTPWGGRVDPAKKGEKMLSTSDIVGENGLGRTWMNLRCGGEEGGKRRENNDETDNDSARGKRQKLNE